MSEQKSSDRSTVSSNKRKKQPSSWDHRATEELFKIVSSHIKVGPKSDMKKWADQFRLMREYDGVEKSTIKRIFRIYKQHIGEKFVPEAFSAVTFREKFSKLLAWEKRLLKDDDESNGNSDDQWGDEKTDITNEVHRVLMQRNPGCGHPNADQEEVDEILVELGYEPGTIDDSMF